MNEKRLFFGAEVFAPWPSEFPQGRIVPEEGRHITLAFLGQTDFEPLQTSLNQFPALPFRCGIAGLCDKLLFLPHEQPRVAAYHVRWLEREEEFSRYQRDILAWLDAKNYKTDKRELLSHVTIARAPFHIHEWKEAFTPIPIAIKGIHLYENLGELKYRSIWSLPLKLPFEELEHTADIAFHVRGEDFFQLHLHAQIALAFKFPQLIPYLSFLFCDNLDDIIIDLNRLVTTADQAIGSPLKAVSFHGKAIKDAQGIFNWEMIVDV